MSNSIIDIGIDIDLPRLLDTRMLVQAGSGGGKSYLLRKIMEMVGKQVQQIILDPEGEFVTLREKFDFALVGKSGDIPLNLKYAEVLAHKLLETGMSAIIDLYELKHHERILFVKNFLTALINARKELWHSCLIYIDEAHMFCPESSKAESAAAVIDLCTRGRKRGFSAVLATQRISKLSKDAAAECLNKLIGMTGLDIDRKRAGEELGFTTKDQLLSLRDHQPGEFYAFGPAISQHVRRFKVGKVTTTHPQAGKRITTVPPTPNAIKKIVEKLADIPQEAEKELETKQQLQAEVTRLRTENTRLQRGNSVSNIPERDSLKDAIKKLQSINNAQILEIKALGLENHKYIQLYSQVWKLLNPFMNSDKQISSGPRDGYNVSFVDQGFKEVAKIKNANVQPGRDISNLPNIPANPDGSYTAKVKFMEGDKKLTKCALLILQFLSVFGKSASKVQAGIATGYSPNSGNFNNSLGELTTRGLITRENGKLSAANYETIKDWIGMAPEFENTPRKYLDKLTKCEREILTILLDHPYDKYSKESIAGRTPSQYSHNSGNFNNALGALNTLGLIERDKGTIKLNPEVIELM